MTNVTNQVQTLTEKFTKISVAFLANLLQGITKSTVCNIIYLVDDNRSKTVQGKKQVQKLVQITHCFLNHNYANKINNLNGTNDFEALPMVGKTRICSTLIQADKTGELMIDGKVLKAQAAKVLCYFHNGIEITEEQAIASNLWTPAYYNPTEKTTMGRGTVSEEDDFAIINTYLCRITKIKIEGTWYEIIK